MQRSYLQFVVYSGCKVYLKWDCKWSIRYYGIFENFYVHQISQILLFCICVCLGCMHTGNKRLRLLSSSSALKLCSKDTIQIFYCLVFYLVENELCVDTEVWNTKMRKYSNIPEEKGESETRKSVHQGKFAPWNWWIQESVRNMERYWCVKKYTHKTEKVGETHTYSTYKQTRTPIAHIRGCGGYQLCLHTVCFCNISQCVCTSVNKKETNLGSWSLNLNCQTIYWVFVT